MYSNIADRLHGKIWKCRTRELSTSGPAVPPWGICPKQINSKKKNSLNKMSIPVIFITAKTRDKSMLTN